MAPPSTPGPEPLDEEAVRRVAKLSRLRLTTDQVSAYRAQLGAVLDHVARLRSLDLDGVEPLAHPLETTNRIDDDTVRDPLPTDVLMSIAPESVPPFIRVPTVLGPDTGA